jgi:hypothetical protein
MHHNAWRTMLKSARWFLFISNLRRHTGKTFKCDAGRAQNAHSIALTDLWGFCAYQKDALGILRPEAA